MIKKRYRWKLSAAIIFALMLVLTHATPVLAAPVLSTAPGSGSVGTTVSVTIDNFDSYIGDGIYLFFDNIKVTSTPLVVPESGSFSLDFTIPSTAQPGDHQISARDESGSILASGWFAVVKTGLIINGNAGTVGSTLQVRGQGFYANRIVSLYYDSRLLGSEAASDIGEFSYSFIIPEGVAGKHSFEAKNIEGQSIDGEFTVLPSISLEPDSAAAGSILTVSGQGFGYMNNIDVFFKNDEVAYAKANETGSFKDTLFTIPEMAPGSYEVIALDKVGNRGSAMFSIIDETVAETNTEITTDGIVEDDTDKSGSSWYIFALIGVGVLLIGILGFWWKRRNTYYS